MSIADRLRDLRQRARLTQEQAASGSGLSHNTLRGAAGGGVLLAELLCAKGYMD